MTPGEDNQTAPGPSARQWCVLLVVDMVESVRLMQRDEAGTIACWRRWVQQVREQVLPPHGGLLVKSLGDGLLLRFVDVATALPAAFALHAAAAALRQVPGLPTDFCLRVGLHAGEVEVDELDVYGQDVNLCARLCGLAQPGDVVVSNTVRDHLRDGLDATLHDLGECYLKHYTHPVRAWQARPCGAQPPAQPRLPQDEQWRTRLLLLPDPHVAPAHRAVSLLAAQELAQAAARHSGWRVISALSAARWGQGPQPQAQPTEPIADIVVDVSLSPDGADWRLALQARRVRDGQPAGQAHGRLSQPGELLAQGEHLVDLLRQLSLSMGHQAQRWHHQAALPNLPSYSLLLAATAGLHATEREAALRATDSLQQLAERHPRSATPRFWLAKADFLSVVQHWHPDPAQAQRQALAHLQRALDAEPDHAPSLALHAHVRRLLAHDTDAAAPDLLRATQQHPNEALAWLFLAGAQSHAGQGPLAQEAASRAWALSPLDPLDYFFLCFAAHAHLAAGDADTACALAGRSVRLNRLHLPGLYVLMIAQVLAGRADAARQTAQRYLQLRPQASVTQYLRAHPHPDAPLTRRDAEALRVAGIPA